jgi:hypothetical protein
LAYLRDLIEAAAQRWDRHVQGYDLQQQLGLLHDVRTTLDGVGTIRTQFSSPRRTILVAFGVALALAGLYWLRRNRPHLTTHPTRRSPTELANLQIVALYHALEAAMAVLGVPRQPSTPPLAHALALRDFRHPAAEEILALTRLYLEVRFGGHHLADSERRDFAHRVKALRQTRSASQAAQAA